MDGRRAGRGAAPLPRCDGAVRLVWLAAVLLLVGCSRPPAATVRGEGWAATLSWSPTMLRALQPARLSLRVEDRRGRPVDVEGIDARADMPDMSHEAEPVRFRRTGAGSYMAEHVFSMDGLWRIHVTGRVGGMPLDARFDLAVGGQ